MDLTKKLSLLVFLVCIFISLKGQKASSPSLDDPSASEHYLREDEALIYDFYSASCPSAEKLIQKTVREMYLENIAIAPALLRLLFHDCFVMGCDASVLLDSHGRIKSEKESPPNLTLKGFEQIDIIKSKVEEACPGVVSCADTLALAARESVLLTGGQFYPVLTGRKDSVDAFEENARKKIPHPDFDVKQAIQSFASKGFDARETVALLGMSGKLLCLIDTSKCEVPIAPEWFTASSSVTGSSTSAKTGGPDPTINAEFLEVLRSQCSHPAPASSTSFENRGLRMDYQGPGKGFGEVYYRSLIQGRGLLFVDQQLTTREDTKAWVEAYASDVLGFRREFGQAMFKLSHLQVAKKGQVRLNCRKVN